MDIVKKVTLFLIALLIGFTFTLNFSYAATNKVVDNETDLRNAIKDASNGDVIELSKDIKLTSPIEISEKTITINGNGNTISKEDSNWSPNGSNGSLITSGIEAKLTLSNVILKNSQKYGVQAYNGGYVILDGVTITNCGYGAILVNAGTVEFRDLTLQKNGTPNNNGIEIAKGDAVAEANSPVVIMNGKISSTEKDNVIYVADNNPNLKNFEVKNTDDTINKIFVDDGKVVLTDSNNKVLYTSNKIKNIEVEGEDYDEQTMKEDKDEQDKTPKTGIESNLELAIFIMILSTISIIALRRKELCD